MLGMYLFAIMHHKQKLNKAALTLMALGVSTVALFTNCYFDMEFFRWKWKVHLV